MKRMSFFSTISFLFKVPDMIDDFPFSQLDKTGVAGFSSLPITGYRRLLDETD